MKLAALILKDIDTYSAVESDLHIVRFCSSLVILSGGKYAFFSYLSGMAVYEAALQIGI